MVLLLNFLNIWLVLPLSSWRCPSKTGMVVVVVEIPEEPQFSQKRGVLLGFFWGRLRRLLVLQTQPLDLLEDLPEEVG